MFYQRITVALHLYLLCIAVSGKASETVDVGNGTRPTIHKEMMTHRPISRDPQVALPPGYVEWNENITFIDVDWTPGTVSTILNSITRKGR